jgi:Cupin superfamily protein
MEQAKRLTALPTADDGHSLRALQRILQPTDVSLFIADFYEQKMLHVARCCPSYFSDLYTARMFEEAVFVASQFAQHLIRVTNADGSNPEVNELRRESWRFVDEPNLTGAGRDSDTPTLHPRKLAEAFANGSTLILSAAATLTSSLSELCRALELDLGFKVRTNAYLTPPNAQGFKLHHDTHDTLILQIEGSKYWSIYEQERRLPLTDEINLINADHKAHTTLLLQPGDTLYLPRGTPHEARATSSRSLHVTVGWYQPRLCDIMIAAVHEAARANLTLRRGVRPAWTHDPALKEELIQEVSSLIGALQSSDCIAAAIDEVTFQAVLGGQGEAAAFLTSLDSLVSLSDSSRVEMRTDVAYEIRDFLFRLEIVVWGRVLTLPASFSIAIEQIKRGPTALRDLRGIPAAERQEFARKLVAIGLARVGS